MWTLKDETLTRVETLRTLIRRIRVSTAPESWQHLWLDAHALRTALETARDQNDWQQAYFLVTEILTQLRIRGITMEIVRRKRRVAQRGLISPPRRATQTRPAQTPRGGGRWYELPTIEETSVPPALDSVPASDVGPDSERRQSAQHAGPSIGSEELLQQAGEGFNTEGSAAGTCSSDSPATETNASQRLERFPQVEVPSHVYAAQPFRIMVQILEEARPGAGVALELAEPDDQDVTVILSVLQGHAVAILGPSEGVLHVPARGNSLGLFFELQGDTVGSITLEVLFQQRGLTRGRIRVSLTLEVQPEASLSAAPVNCHRGEASFAPWLPTAMLLTFLKRESEGDETEFYVLLNQQKFIQRIPENYQTVVDSLVRDMKALLRSEDTEARELRLKNLGSKLANKLLPAEVREALSSAPEGTPLHIQCDDLWIPWEFLVPGLTRGAFYLGEHFALTRSVNAGPHALKLSRGTSVLIASPSVLDSEQERSALQAFAGQEPQSFTRSREAIERFLAGERISALHFVCHGLSPETDPLGGRLLLEDKSVLAAIDVPGLDQLGEDAPLKGSLVFINACLAGTPSDGLGGYGSFADAFLNAGAAAVIVPSWSVADSYAVKIAQVFYERLSTGVRPAEALRQARVNAAREGSSYSHAYALYAQPDLLLAA